MSRVLVLGAGGMLGHKLCQCLSEHEIIGTVRKDTGFYDKYHQIFNNVNLIGGVDVLDNEKLEQTIRKVAPDVIINCIGIVKQLKEANNAFLSIAINSLLPHKLAILCADIGTRLITISTDCVFDGTRSGYRENDFSNARDLYGKSKFLGETTSDETAAVTLRTSFIGREIMTPTHGLIEWFLAQQKKTIRGFDKAIYSGFTSIELARMIALIIKNYQDICGVYQVASKPITKYNLLQLVKEIFELDVNITCDKDFCCDRSLNMDRFTQTTGYVAPSWEEMIRKMYKDPTDYDNMRTDD
ncbi:MAG: SDR family oxidoreductase [Planctomycetes bacterium]|nr:SDR family oxidoreductase [Planctomycetota bacterium]